MNRIARFFIELSAPLSDQAPTVFVSGGSRGHEPRIAIPGINFKYDPDSGHGVDTHRLFSYLAVTGRFTDQTRERIAMTAPTRLLFVDDEEALRVLVKAQLEAEGFQVETADDGDTAMEILAKQSYDVILLDIRMPRVSGIEVLQQVRKRGIKSRVIILTAVDDLSVAIEAVKNGANDYLTKPYQISSLMSSIQRVMAK
jgi:CheY-like chemotaxis protein